MEDVRPYSIENEPKEREDERRTEFEAVTKTDDEVPFHIPRD